MRYAKLVEGALQYAPKNKIGGPGEPTYTPYPEDMLIEDGYKPVVYTNYPSDGNIYSESWREDPEAITQVWVLEHELTPTERRELAYQTEKCCTYEEETYTCDELESLYYKYFAESGKEEKCAEIKAVITAGKAHIREEYPDEAGEE